jgi:hypothetical protein
MNEVKRRKWGCIVFILTGNTSEIHHEHLRVSAGSKNGFPSGKKVSFDT